MREFENFIKEKLKDQISDIDELIKEANESKISLEEFLYSLGKLEENFLELKKEFFNLPVKKFEAEEKIPKEILTLISEDFAKKNKIIAFDKRENEIYIGVVDPSVENFNETINFIRNSLNLEPKIFLISIKDFYNILKQYKEFSETLKNVLFQIRETKKPVVEEKPIELSAEILPTEEAPIIRLVQSLIEEAVYLRASDIHIEPWAKKTRIRFRILGDLKTIAYLPKDIHEQIINRIKVLSKLKLDETRIPQDGRIKVIVHGREIDLRIGILPTVGGEKVAIRVLDPLVGLKKLEDLGMLDYNLVKVDKEIKSPYGLILITGPTGSGKTTTLYAILQKLNKEDVNIISLEDPVEYRIDGVNQSQIRPEIGYSFATGLREILRQDPDVILVGEIRDLETAELTIHASLTGHLVLSTLHTNNALGAITRLIDIGIERYLIPPTLRLIVAQRLAKKLCDECKKAIKPTEDLIKIIKENLNNLDRDILEKYNIDLDNLVIYHPAGCNKCDNKGYTGRLGIFEVVIITEELEDSIYSGKTEIELEKLLPKQKFVSLRQDGIIKALLGYVTLEEVLKIT